MRRIGKWLKRIGFALLALVAVVIAAALVVWEKPELLLNEKRVKWALRFAPKGTEVSWSAFRWTFSREGFLGKGTDLELRDLCFRYGSQASGCAPRVKLDASFTVAGFHPRLTRLGAFVLEVSRLRYHAAKEKDPAPKKTGPLPDLRPPSFASVYPAAVDPSKAGDVRISLADVRLESDEGAPLDATFLLEKREGAVFAAELTAKKGKALSAGMKGSGSVQDGAFAWKGTATALASGWNLRFPFELRWSDRISLGGSPVAIKGQDRYSTPLALLWTKDRLGLDLGRLALDKLWAKKRVLIDSCRLESSLDAKEGYPKRSALHCGLALLSLEAGAILPPMKAAVDADLDLAPKGKDTAEAKLALREKGRNDYLASDLDFKGSARFHPAKGGLEGTPDLALIASLRVPNLQRWKSALEATPLALPAPFRTLSGPAELRLRLDRATQEELLLTANLSTDFHGGREALVTRHVAGIRVARPFRGPRAVNVDASAELTDVALEAPPLNLGAPPQFLPDNRIEKSAKGEAARKAEPGVPVHWKAHVTSKAPVRIRTNLLESEIPVALNLGLADVGGMDGTITIQPMPIEVFKKKANVTEIALTFHEGSTVGDLNGTVVYRNPEIAVRILLLGSTDKPRVEFLSDPPLSRQQIVSVLLFNKSPDQLTEDEASSAGSFSQATADGALGLFSLLFLSSTPIESISYDPVSQTYTAKLRLDKKTTLAVGSDFDRERQVALRRRLGGRWAIRTELHNQQGQPDVLLTLLEWFKRF